jgi:hypothetical protein
MTFTLSVNDTCITLIIFIHKADTVISFHFILKNQDKTHAWWFTPIIPALRRLRQEDHEFKASLGYIARPCLKNKPKEPKPKKLSSLSPVTQLILGI